MVLNVAEYTITELEKALINLELNFRQSPVCITCIQKNLWIIEGLAEEGIKFIPDKKDMFVSLIQWLQSIQQIKNFTYHNIMKQVLLLQIHLTDFIKYQTNKDILFCKDCLQKHLLLIEKLTEELIKKPTAKQLNELVTKIRLNLNNLTVDEVTRYIQELDEIFNTILYDWNINFDVQPYNFADYIKVIDQARRDFLPAEQCFKCQAFRQESEGGHL